MRCNIGAVSGRFASKEPHGISISEMLHHVRSCAGNPPAPQSATDLHYQLRLLLPPLTH